MERIYQHILNSIPESVDFNFIPIKNEAIRTIYLDNISEISVYFKIEHTAEYQFEPNNGVVTKKTKMEIKIRINPQVASVIVANANITLDNKTSKVIKISSISKFPYIKINKDSLDLGIVTIGKTSETELIISNPETVPAKFTISRQSNQPGKHPELFTLSEVSGEVPPNASYLIKIKYKTVFPSLSSHESYLIKTIGGNQLRFSCNGSCSALKTWLGAKCVNFKSIALGSQMTKLIRIYNESELPTEYQMFYMNSGAFIINKTQGIIPAKSNVRIRVTFKPYDTMVYYERVFCLTKNHFLTVLDLYGSSNDLLTKPRILEQKSIDIFRFKLLNGFYFGKTMQGMESDILDKLNRTFGQRTTIEEKSSDDALAAFTNQTQLHKEMFWETTSPNRIISCDTEYIDFNYVEENQLSEPYKVRVHNNSNEKVKIKWILDKPVNLSNLLQGTSLFNTPNLIFFVQPEESIINKKSHVEFKVYFKPNKLEYYFYSDMPCQATLMTNYNTNTSKGIPPIEGNKLSQTGVEMANLTQSHHIKTFNRTKTKSTVFFKNSHDFEKTLKLQSQAYNYFDPPIPLKLSMVGHSFPPGTQMFMPLYSMTPANELFFPSVSINQSTYQTIKIQNNSDTPLFYKFSTDPLGVFRVHRKYGLIEPNEFHLACIEFCPKDCTVYRFPMRIILNHDNQNMKTILLNGLSTDPVIELEGLKNEVYFPPCHIGVKSTKSITVKNLSPIRINVQISMEKNPNAIIEVQPCYFEMEPNLVRKIVFSMIPTKTEEIICPMIFNIERVYDPSNESVGIFNPGSSSIKSQGILFDKRNFKREVTLLGRGSDGNLTIDPILLDFGTVKVGFHKKMSFKICNPTITNFYIKLRPEFDENFEETSLSRKEKAKGIKFDFEEGLINSFCQKEVNITFSPKTRAVFNLNVCIYASDNIPTTNNPSNKNSLSKDIDQISKVQFNTGEFENTSSLKCQMRIKANGDYPLIKIVDLRNTSTGTCTLWKNFNVNEANKGLQEKLTDEEINYMASDITNKNNQEYKDKLKCIKCDFGKHLLKSSLNQKKIKRSYDVYVTLKNEGGVPSEFFFKFPDDVAIKREIWMDPVEPTSADIIEYHVLKENIFEIEPRKGKLDPGECCNIRFRYNIKEKGDHHLRLIFQIVNGKPLIFELNGESYLEKSGVLEIQNPILDFEYVPIGCMNHIASSIELTNVGGSQIKYHINSEDFDKFNKENEDVNVLIAEDLDGIIGPFDSKFICSYFRPIEHKCYELNLIVYYTDEINIYQKPITIKGFGYHPHKFTPPNKMSPFEGLPNYCLWNYFDKDMIQKCGTNIQEIDFGEINDKPVTKTLILYNYSMVNSFTFEFPEPGFMLKDELKITPNKGLLEENSHIYIKMCLTPKKLVSRYEGELGIKIAWNATSTKEVEKEQLYIRIVKKSLIKDTPGLVEMTYNPNCSAIELLLRDLTKEILGSKSFDNLLCENIENQPLTLYNWTSEIAFPDHKDLRKKIIGDFGNRVIEAMNEQCSISPTRKNYSKTMSSGLKSNQLVIDPELNNFGESADFAIQEKYSKEVLNKYKLTISEMNEKIIVINQDTRNLISNIIMENTIFNILSEAVYGEVNLTEKVRIYFFASRNQPEAIVSQTYQNPINRLIKEDEQDQKDKDKDKDKDNENENDDDKENTRYLK